MKSKATQCKCHPESPFLWRQNPRPSIFAKDPTYRVTSEGQTLSQMSTNLVEKSRQEGKNSGYIKGLAKNREAEILRMRNFSIYMKSMATGTKDDGEHKESEEAERSE